MTGIYEGLKSLCDSCNNITAAMYIYEVIPFIQKVTLLWSDVCSGFQHGDETRVKKKAPELQWGTLVCNYHYLLHSLSLNQRLIGNLIYNFERGERLWSQKSFVLFANFSVLLLSASKYHCMLVTYDDTCKR